MVTTPSPAKAVPTSVPCEIWRASAAQWASGRDASVLGVALWWFTRYRRRVKRALRVHTLGMGICGAHLERGGARHTASGERRATHGGARTNSGASARQRRAKACCLGSEQHSVVVQVQDDATRSPRLERFSGCSEARTSFASDAVLTVLVHTSLHYPTDPTRLPQPPPPQPHRAASTIFCTRDAFAGLRSRYMDSSWSAANPCVEAATPGTRRRRQVAKSRASGLEGQCSQGGISVSSDLFVCLSATHAAYVPAARSRRRAAWHP